MSKIVCSRNHKEPGGEDEARRRQVHMWRLLETVTDSEGSKELRSFFGEWGDQRGTRG